MAMNGQRAPFRAGPCPGSFKARPSLQLTVEYLPKPGQQRIVLLG
jgi:hypothetical protein